MSEDTLRISALENALDILSQQLVDANRIIAQLSAINTRAPDLAVDALINGQTVWYNLNTGETTMSDPPQSEPSAADADKHGLGATDPVIDAAIGRLPTASQRDRGLVRKALDKAEAPPSGRDAANQALGRISRRS